MFEDDHAVNICLLLTAMIQRKIEVILVPEEGTAIGNL